MSTVRYRSRTSAGIPAAAVNRPTEQARWAGIERLSARHEKRRRIMADLLAAIPLRRSEARP